MVAALLVLSLVDVSARGKPLPGGALQGGLIHQWACLGSGTVGMVAAGVRHGAREQPSLGAECTVDSSQCQ